MRDKLGLEYIWPSTSQSASATATVPNWRAYESTDRRTCIDWCMSRACSSANQQSSSSSQQETNSRTTTTTTTSCLTVYESWFSDHKPLWLEINFNS